jgi:hypothetical protein
MHVMLKGQVDFACVSEAVYTGMRAAAKALELPVSRVLQVVRASGEATGLGALSDVYQPSGYDAAVSRLAEKVASDLGVPSEVAYQRCVASMHQD